MSLMLRNLFLLHRLMDEATDGGGGGAGDLTIDIDKASDDIGGALGLGDKDEQGDNDLGSATPPKEKTPATPPTDEKPEVKAAREAREKAVAATAKQAALKDPVQRAKLVGEAKTALTAKQQDFTGKTDDEILALAEAAAKPQTKEMVKAWKKEMAETWAKLPPEAQDYIAQREAQVEEGFKVQAPAVKYANAVFGLLAPHEGLLKSQGMTNHVDFLNSMVQAHVVLSSHPDAQRYQYMANVFKSYGLDPAKVAEAYTALGVQPPAQETAAERELRARLTKVEEATKTEQTQRFNALKASTDAEVAAFAADPKHQFFDEVASEVSLFLADPRITLEKAYEMAVFANPVTRAKELARLRGDAEKTAREEADKAAAAAAAAKGTRIRGKEEHRASPDLLGSMDDTLRSTLKEIHSRT